MLAQDSGTWGLDLVPAVIHTRFSFFPHAVLACLRRWWHPQTFNPVRCRHDIWGCRSSYCVHQSLRHHIVQRITCGVTKREREQRMHVDLRQGSEQVDVRDHRVVFYWERVREASFETCRHKSLSIMTEQSKLLSLIQYCVRDVAKILRSCAQPRCKILDVAQHNDSE